jgi:hypothetical protein
VTTPRVLTAVLLCGLACLLAVAVVPRGATTDPASAVPVATSRVAPLAVLAGWDADRSRAWRDGDPQALATLYTAGSRSGRADRTLLAAYAARGLRVRGLEVQRASVEVEAVTTDRMVLLVTDRLVATTVSRRGSRPVELPRDDWSTRRVVLRRVGERWRVAEVRDPDARARPRPPR